jgi:hypothetical protein
MDAPSGEGRRAFLRYFAVWTDIAWVTFMMRGS